MKLIRHTVLRFKQGQTSDKVYETDIVEVAGEYLVNFRYGKYGANLREGSKTKSPVELNQATKIADSLLVSKINKGYRVIAGYDPVDKVTIGIETAGNESTINSPVPFSSAERDEKIIARLEKFCAGDKYLDDTDSDIATIDGYSFSRSLWKAGELRIKGIVPVIEKALSSKHLFESGVDYYTALWALGRVGDEYDIRLAEKIGKHIPDNTEYMITEIKMALSSRPESLIPSYQAINAAETVDNIQTYADIEDLSFDRLASQQLIFINRVLDLHGIDSDVKAAVKKVTIDDAFKDFDTYAESYLSEQTLTVLKQGKAAYPKLEDAIEKLLDHHKAGLRQTAAEPFKLNYDLYMEIIKTLDLNKIFDGDQYDISNAERGRVNWLWGSEKGNLIKAIKKTRKSSNINALLQHVERYADLMANATLLSAQQVDQYHQVLKEAGVYPDAIQAINAAKMDTYPWGFKNSLSPEIRAKFEADIDYQVERLFDHRFSELRETALEPKAALLNTLQSSMLGLYWGAKSDNHKRENLFSALQHIHAREPFTQIFRRLYKMAEFRDDFECLAVLNYRMERTEPSSNSYWSSRKNPLSRETKDYFRRRMVRTLKNVAKFNAPAYSGFAAAALCQADDNDDVLAVWSDKKKSHHFPKLAALNFILHKNSRCFSSNYLGIWILTGEQKEGTKPEAFPELWQSASADLFNILRQCKAKIVNDFAFKKIKPHTDYLDTVQQSDWMALVQRPYENTALLALDYLKDNLNDLEVMQAVLFAQFGSVRKKALDVLDGETLGQQLELLMLMLLSEHDDVYDFAKSYLYSAQDHYTELSNKLIEVLLNLESHEQDAADKVENDALRARLLPRIEWLLLHPLKNHAALKNITQLLEQPRFELQQLAANLLEVSEYSFNELEQSYQLMSASEYPEIRAGAIALLAKLNSDEEKMQHKALLFSALTDAHPSLREKSRDVVVGIDDPVFKMDAFNHVLPELFKTEPVEGYADDMLLLVEGLESIHSDIDGDVLWRLLHAKSKLAEWSGAAILPSHQVSEFSVKQLALLSKNATVSVRDWALDAFEADLTLTTENYSQAIRLLDNRWDDSRSRAVTFFKSQFDDSFWNSERTIAVCDNIYPDVQRFGRDLVTKFFTAEQGEEYLIKLSQHPSANVQLFVSGFLKEYASDKPDIIISLKPYFTTVLSQVNRGRLVKDRIISFLFNEAKKAEDVADMVADLFSDQSISMVIADKMQYIKALFQLQQQFTQIKTPVVSIEPEVRAV